MDTITLLGLAAGGLTTVAFLPQFIKVWRTRSAGDLSLPMYVVICSGIFLWLLYGIAIGSIPVILANAVTLVIAGGILIMKIRYR